MRHVKYYVASKSTNTEATGTSYYTYIAPMNNKRWIREQMFKIKISRDTYKRIRVGIIYRLELL